MGVDFIEIEASYFSNRINDAIYINFPHEFVCKMIYRLSAEGLTLTTNFKNLGNDNMPVGMGFHTPLNIPFRKDGNKDDYRIRISVGDEWELNERNLPTGKLLELTGDKASLRTIGIEPCGKPIEWALTNKPFDYNGKEYNGAILSDKRNNISVFYEVDQQFKHWTFWNNGGEEPYACPEPQSWAINAPNLNMPDETTGFQSVEPGKEWKAVTKLYVREN